MYRIRILKNGEAMVPGPLIFNLSRYNEEVRISLYFYLIEGSGKAVVVDTGMDDMPSRFGFKTVGPCKNTLPLLREAGVDPEDVDYLILTHLHGDHCANIKLFTKAKVVVSRREWLHVIAPVYREMSPDSGPTREAAAYLAGEAWGRLVLVGDEEEILPGLGVFWTGGHTPGSQCASVKTRMGRAIITGDVVDLYENLEKNIPIGIHYNLFECFDAMKRIQREADIVLTMHDPQVLERYPNGVVG
jgi:glyoxylase-like metal-dependent hydrolase (beta-lactamase superfamily II)